MIIRDEAPTDADVISSLTERAFATAPHASGTEAAIVQALRDAGALTVSLIAEKAGEITGHAAFSPIRINDAPSGWFGLGPVSVSPEWQRSGTGTALIQTGLTRLKDMGADGCVVLGDPEFYRRFGFACQPELRLADVPPAYFQALSFQSGAFGGEVAYHPAFAIELPLLGQS